MEYTPGIEGQEFNICLDEKWYQPLYYGEGILSLLEAGETIHVPLTKEILDNYLNELIMSKNKKKIVTVVAPVVPTEPTEETIKAVFDLYKPNKLQKFIMKFLSKIETTNHLRNGIIITCGGLTVLGIVYGIFGLKQASIALFSTTLIIGVPTLAAIMYNTITNEKRVKAIASVLNMDERNVIELEKKYYL